MAKRHNLLPMSQLSMTANINGHEVTFAFLVPEEMPQDLQQLLDWSFDNDAAPRTTADAAVFDTVCPKITYAKKVVTGSDDDKCCAVCRSDFKPRMHVRRLPCGHLFCSKCISRWVTKESATCPSCRTPLQLG